MSNNSKCASYFKGQSAYRRCFAEFKKKWEIYGRTAGTILLRETTEEERRAIGGILGKTFYEPDIRFSFARFEEGLQKTKYAPVDMKGVLECYFEQELSTNQERVRRKRQEKQGFAEELSADFRERLGPESAAYSWMAHMQADQKYGWQLLMREYEKDREDAALCARNVGTALEALAGKRGFLSSDTNGAKALAVFAAEISGNPHYFDRGTIPGQLFVNALCFWLKCRPPGDAHGWRELMAGVGITPDNLSSFVYVYGLHLRTREGVHPAYEAFCRMGEPFTVTLENLRRITGISSGSGRVYVVENEMVFSFLIEHFRDREFPVLCTSGQPRTAALALLDLIVKAGKQAYYSGDMDPEGLDIADRLWKRYGDRLHIWRMSPEDYKAGLSDERIEKARLSKLSHVEHPVLCRTAECIRGKKKAAYQENILQELLQDLRDASVKMEFADPIFQVSRQRQRKQKSWKNGKILKNLLGKVE